LTDSTLSTVRNAARVLKAFLSKDDELGVSELARRVGLGKSSVHRLLTTLRAEGLVEQDPRTGRYRLGIVMFELGELVRIRMDLGTAAWPALAILRDRTGEAAQVSIADGEDVVYLERVEGTTIPLLVTDQERRAPMYCTAAGKVLLAFKPEAELAGYLSGTRLTALTRHTITDPARLRGQLTVVRSRGWADSINEQELGLASLASVVRDSAGRTVAAIGVSAPVNRFRRLARRHLEAIVTEAAASVSRRLGWAGAAAESARDVL
jgi:DNA-binding IclR family transcriptional regulator